jgi:biopolymer transport protein ExbD/biopolymer transport protein TolR
VKGISPKRSLYEPLADINVTPLVDVMLVLLIVFMITAPMLAAGMKVELPKAQSAEPLDPKEPIVITFQKSGKLFIGRDEIAEDAMVAAVRARVGSDPDRAIHLRGDRDVAYGEMIELMDRLAASGFSKLALLATATGQAAETETRPVH